MAKLEILGLRTSVQKTEVEFGRKTNQLLARSSLKFTMSTLVGPIAQCSRLQQIKDGLRKHEELEMYLQS